MYTAAHEIADIAKQQKLAADKVIAAQQDLIDAYKLKIRQLEEDIVIMRLAFQGLC